MCGQWSIPLNQEWVRAARRGSYEALGWKLTFSRYQLKILIFENTADQFGKIQPAVLKLFRSPTKPKGGIGRDVQDVQDKIWKTRKS
jgi:hypothetical protein